MCGIEKMTYSEILDKIGECERKKEILENQIWVYSMELKRRRESMPYKRV